MRRQGCGADWTRHEEKSDAVESKIDVSDAQEAANHTARSCAERDRDGDCDYDKLLGHTTNAGAGRAKTPAERHHGRGPRYPDQCSAGVGARAQGYTSAAACDDTLVCRQTKTPPRANEAGPRSPNQP
jgi:hypothetical protein